MKSIINKLHGKLGDLWWYSLMIFIACRSGDAIQAFIGLWLVPKYVGQEELGAVLPLQQLSGLFAVPLAIIATVFAKYVNTYATRGEFGKVKSFIRDVLLTAIVVFVACIVVAYIVIPHFYMRLNVASGMLTILILAAGFASNIANLFTSALQGLKKFKTMTIQNLIGAPIRLITMLVAMPYRALSGYILGQATPPATCSILAAYSLHQDLKLVPLDTTWRKDLTEIWRYLWPVAIYMGFGTLFGTMSATVYRQRLPEVESAAYYLLGRFSEIAGYFGLSVSLILFPLVAESHENGKENTKLLRQAIWGMSLSNLLIAGAFALTANWLLSLNATWTAYQPYASLLPLLTITCGTSGIIGAVISYEMACRRFFAATCIVVINGLWVAFIVAFTGYEFFIGILPDSYIAFMKSCHIADLNRITHASIVSAVIQLSALILVFQLRNIRTHWKKTQ